MRVLSSEVDDPVVRSALRDPQLHGGLLDQLDKGVCMLDRDGRILYWNQAAERISGFLAQEVAGQSNHGDLMRHCANYDALLGHSAAAFTESAPEGKQRDSIVLLLHREGHRILVYVQSRIIRDESGQALGEMEVFEEVVNSGHRGVREFEAYGCADSSRRAANRRYGEMKARQAIEALNGFEIPFGWLRVGLDGAGEMNREFGHGMVEAAVKLVVAALDRNLRPEDVLTRWDGAELRAQISRCSHSELAAAAERLCLLVRSSALEWWGDRLQVTVSVGGATAESGDTLESLDARASGVFEGCRASGGDRAAVAHVTRSGAGRCSQ